MSVRKHWIERMEPDPEDLHYHEHVARYRFARERLAPGDILDVASGSGYGSALLGERSRHTVVGVDRDRQTVARATQQFGSSRVRFLEADACKLPFDNEHFGSVVSLETLAFIENDHGFLQELVRVLSPDGVCVLSTPNRAYSERHGIEYPYHAREYYEDELLDLLHAHFGTVTLFFQGLSSHYHSKVGSYAQEIEDRKRQFGTVQQLGIKYLYRPLRDRIPKAVKDSAIRRITGRTYPMPDIQDICISPTPLDDTAVFIAVLRLHPAP